MFLSTVHEGWGSSFYAQSSAKKVQQTNSTVDHYLLISPASLYLCAACLDIQAARQKLAMYCIL